MNGSDRRRISFFLVIAGATAVLMVCDNLDFPTAGLAQEHGTTAPPDGVTERGGGGIQRPEMAPLSDRLFIDKTNPPPPKSDLVGRKVSASGCGPGRIGMALVEVKNQGVGQSGAFFTQINSYNKQVRVRAGALPPGGAFTHQVQVGCSPQGPCAVNGVVDVDREVAESNATNNGLSFSYP